MKNVQSFFRKYPPFPLFVSLVAVLSLWVVNIDQVPFYAILSSLLFSIAIAILVIVICLLITRNIQKGSILAGVALLLFFSYGHLFQIFEGKKVFGFVFGRNIIFLIMYAAIFCFVMILLLHRKKISTNIIDFLNSLVGFLLIFAFIQTLVFFINSYNARRELVSSTEEMSSQEIGGSFLSENPDVYYILIDGYSRQDLLLDKFGINNSSFIEDLKGLGFIIPKCTQSNYANTMFSMTSTLNMNYLDELGVQINQSNEESFGYIYSDLLRHSVVREKFASYGYKFATFKSIFQPINIQDSDFYFDISKNNSKLNLQESVNFRDMFLHTTMMKAVIDKDLSKINFFRYLPTWIKNIVQPKLNYENTETYLVYQKNLFDLNELKNIPKIDDKKFVYAHLFLTHEPFVFKKNGDYRSEDNSGVDAFRDQIIFTDDQLLEIVRNLLHDSSKPPIIIIQADHSYGWDKNRNKILNAYYLPGVDPKVIYDSITPVNTFRIIFNEYFHENYDMLADKVYYSPKENLSSLQLMPVSCTP